MGNFCSGLCPGRTGGYIDTGDFYVSMKAVSAHVTPLNQLSSSRDVLELARFNHDPKLMSSTVSNDKYQPKANLIVKNTVKKHHETLPPSSIEERRVKAYAENRECDTNVFYEAIVSLEKRYEKKGDDFLKILSKYPRAIDLWGSVHAPLSQEEAIRVTKLYQFSENSVRAGRISSKMAYAMVNLSDRIAQLETSCKLYDSGDIKAKFYGQLTHNQIDLLKEQKKLEKITGQPKFVDKSLNETIQTLIALTSYCQDALTLATELAHKFSMSPDQFWWSLLRGLVYAGEWEVLHDLAVASRPPIGYVPIVEALLDGERLDLAQNVYGVIKDKEERTKVTQLFMAMGDSTIPIRSS